MSSSKSIQSFEDVLNDYKRIAEESLHAVPTDQAYQKVLALIKVVTKEYEVIERLKKELASLTGENGEETERKLHNHKRELALILQGIVK